MPWPATEAPPIEWDASCGYNHASSRRCELNRAGQEESRRSSRTTYCCGESPAPARARWLNCLCNTSSRVPRSDPIELRTSTGQRSGSEILRFELSSQVDVSSRDHEYALAAVVDCGGVFRRSGDVRFHNAPNK